ncbi:MAG: hypothetical protein A2X61_09760 [Ignavibacteria bacterium GWB2_35_12]|nr:MAG: hypothetical protein A2X61_09760 [Ignavibacteria bacterium GWB2_35_12]OGU90988.1 MAG: hypothetical protein A2220_06865 [Ignavibacteria bacterium RIFOXYA2_FULL_35_10]OGV22720.1 MAG: hypothetical protein A2475_01665 [Ignavibacteria bacterium RIFOXYC2_FULL_35_21]
MTDDRIELIRYRLSKSEDTYNDALYLAEGKKWNAATNRLYYSAYYSVHALLLCINLSPRTHKGTRTLFHQHFLSTNMIPKEFGDLYTLIFEARQEGDYVDFAEQNEESVSFFISNVRLFNDKIKNLISNEFLSRF